MKNLFLILSFLILNVSLAQEKKPIQQKKQIVEASCGQCQFGMKGQGCDLAVRIDGKPYFVEGTHIDKHGDAHAEDGFCQTIRTAEVAGTIKDSTFVVTHFKLLPKK